MGIELTTYRLQGGCSTSELIRLVWAYSITRKSPLKPRLSLKRLERIPHRWHLTFFASAARKSQPYGFHIAKLSMPLLFALSKPGRTHQKHTWRVKSLLPTSHGKYAFGGSGGNRTRVQNTF